MNKATLPCCVVRDLLPSRLEGILSPETDRQMQEHLRSCPECRELERRLRAGLPLQPAPKRALRFLKHAKRLRRLIFILALALIILLVWEVCAMHGI